MTANDQSDQKIKKIRGEDCEQDRRTDLEEYEAAWRAGGGGEVSAERGDEAVAVAGVQLHGHSRRGEGGRGGGRHGWEPRRREWLSTALGSPKLQIYIGLFRIWVGQVT